MARGGKREGAGRKEGATTVASREAAENYLQSGKKTPLEVMLEAMHFAMEQVEKTANVLEKKIFYEAAHAHAKDAAPYLHAKLASMEVKAEVSGTITHNLADKDRDILAAWKERNK